MPSTPQTLLRALLAAALLAIALWLLWPSRAGSPEERAARAQGRVIITFWDRHSGHEHAARKALIDEFNRSQNRIYVRAVPIGYNAAMEKILTSTAGGAPPDICSLDTTLIAQLAGQGLFRPLDDLMADTPGMRETDYFPHAWRMVAYDGHVWAAPITLDVYCLVWNKALFREAGLDPERGPQTTDDLLAYAARLTRRDLRGRIERMGFVPWLPWEHDYLWGILFGGQWYDPHTDRFVMANDPGIIASLDFQRRFVNRGDGQAHPGALTLAELPAFTEGARDYMSASNPLYSGQVAMIIEGEWQATFIPKYAPGLDWGVGPLPQPPGAPIQAWSPAGVADVIPTTARHPHEALQFLRWFNTPRPGGTSPVSDLAFAIHNIPPRPQEARQPRFMDNPKFRVYVEQMLHKPVASLPINPVVQYMLDELERLRERTIRGDITPEAAARQLEDSANRELARVRRLAARTVEPAT
jgi:multiple sugar transport system substrate-binding protein